MTSTTRNDVAFESGGLCGSYRSMQTFANAQAASQLHKVDALRSSAEKAPSLSQLPRMCLRAEKVPFCGENIAENAQFCGLFSLLPTLDFRSGPLVVKVKQCPLVKLEFLLPRVFPFQFKVEKKKEMTISRV